MIVNEISKYALISINLLGNINRLSLVNRQICTHPNKWSEYTKGVWEIYCTCTSESHLVNIYSILLELTFFAHDSKANHVFSVCKSVRIYLSFLLCWSYYLYVLISESIENWEIQFCQRCFIFVFICYKFQTCKKKFGQQKLKIAFKLRRNSTPIHKFI